MKILLVGGAGFIGLNLACVLVRQGHEVHIADRPTSLLNSKRFTPSVNGHHVIQGIDAEQLISMIDEIGVECVIGLTSSLIPSSSFEEFEIELNHIISPTFRMLEHLAKRDIRFVYFSSGGTVYGINNNHVISENEPLLPINHYGYSKVLFEKYLSFAGRAHQLRYLIIRPSNPFGPYQNPHRRQGLVAVAVDKILHGQPIEVWGDGSIVRDYIWVEDLAEAVAALLLKVESWGKIFNIGSGKGHSVQALLAMIGELTGNRIDILYRSARNVDAPRLVLDISRLQSVIDFQPRDLRDGLKLYLGMQEER